MAAGGFDKGFTSGFSVGFAGELYSRVIDNLYSGGTGANRPPKPLPRIWSKSEGDRKRGSFRPSKYPRLFQRAISSDDGSPTTIDFREILGELRLIRQEV